MSWKHDLDALIESTMTFVQDLNRQHPAELKAVSRTAEQALLDTPKTIPAPNKWIVLPVSETDQIRQRVSNFKAHQQKLAQDREDYYLQTKARMMASFPSPKEKPLA